MLEQVAYIMAILGAAALVIGSLMAMVGESLTRATRAVDPAADSPIWL